MRKYRPDVVHSWLYQSDWLQDLCGYLKNEGVDLSIRQTNISAKHNRAFTIMCAKLCMVFSEQFALRDHCHQSVRDSHVAIGYEKSRIFVTQTVLTCAFAPTGALAVGFGKELGIEDKDLLVGLVKSGSIAKRTLLYSSKQQH